MLLTQHLSRAGRIRPPYNKGCFIAPIYNDLYHDTQYRVLIVKALYQQNADKSAHHANQYAPPYFGVGVLSQNEACRAHHAAEQRGEAHPPCGVEGKDERKGYQCPHHTPRGGSVCADFDKVVDNGAHHLYDQRAANHPQRKAWHVNAVEQVEQCTIAHNAQHVRHITAFAAAHLVPCPPIQLAVAVYGHMGQQYGKEVYNQRKYHLCLHGQHVQVAEQEQHHKSHYRQVKRRVERRHNVGSEHYQFAAPPAGLLTQFVRRVGACFVMYVSIVQDVSVLC